MTLFHRKLLKPNAVYDEKRALVFNYNTHKFTFNLFVAIMDWNFWKGRKAKKSKMEKQNFFQKKKEKIVQKNETYQQKHQKQLRHAHTYTMNQNKKRGLNLNILHLDIFFFHFIALHFSFFSYVSINLSNILRWRFC